MVEEKPIAQQRLFTGHLVAVDELTVKLDNQQTAKREIVRAHPAVLSLLFMLILSRGPLKDV